MKPGECQAIQQILIEQTGGNIGKLEAQPVTGGDVNSAYRISDGRQEFFVKLNRIDRLSMFEAEMRGLNEIHASDSIRCPQPLACGVTGDHAFIVMEYLDLSGRMNQTQFAQQLASMHLCQQKEFGFSIDNTIGSNPQTNGAEQDWKVFWQKHRLESQLNLTRANGPGGDLYDAGMQLGQVMGGLFTDYSPVASLLHGDLWSGNQAADAAGNPVIFDPACYYGDHETDLAMMELFGCPSPHFFDAYNDVFPIDPGYSQRRDFYNLYHILNHANLFGGGYGNQARQMIDRLRVELG